MKITVPFHRLSWIMACIFLPAALQGWAACLGWQDGFPFYGIAWVASIILTPLSWSDHVQNHVSRGCLGVVALGTFQFIACLMWAALVGNGGPIRGLETSQCGTMYFLILTFAIALANPEGLTPVLLLLNAFVATGLAQHFSDGSHRLGLALWVPGWVFVLGLVASLIRRASLAPRA